MSVETQVSEARQKLEQAIAELGLTVESTFIPFSQSRSKAEKNYNLNWEVTLKKDGRHVLTTEYSAGMAHCPAYKKIKPMNQWGRFTLDDMELIKFECERGQKAHRNIDHISGNGKIEPDTADVIHSLVLDSDVVNAGSFEEWAGDLGYDCDSIKHKKIYKACLKIGLKLLQAVGTEGMRKLQEAGQDY